MPGGPLAVPIAQPSASGPKLLVFVLLRRAIVVLLLRKLESVIENNIHSGTGTAVPGLAVKSHWQPPSWPCNFAVTTGTGKQRHCQWQRDGHDAAELLNPLAVPLPGSPSESSLHK